MIHKSIVQLANKIIERHGLHGEVAMLFPSEIVAHRCSQFLLRQERELDAGAVRILIIAPSKDKMSHSNEEIRSNCTLAAVLYPKKFTKTAKSYWQHTGEGISSRRAEDFWVKSNGGLTSVVHKGEPHDRITPQRYHGCRRRSYSQRKPVTGWKGDSVQKSEQLEDCRFFIEERFGRNLDRSLAFKAKIALRRRISGCSISEDPPLNNQRSWDAEAKLQCTRKISENDVYLYPTGMSAIYNTHRSLLGASGMKKSIIYGYGLMCFKYLQLIIGRFPYVDTLKILENFGPGCLFYGQGSQDELQDLEDRLERGEKYVALFCEFPGNPLLNCPDIARIKSLADKYGFIVVVDETIGNFLNIDVMPYADVVVSSLTKIFSGDSNVMGGR